MTKTISCRSESACVHSRVRMGHRAGRREGFGSQITSSNVWQVCIRHNFSKNYPQDLKMVQKVAPCDSLQSPLKITY